MTAPGPAGNASGLVPLLPLLVRRPERGPLSELRTAYNDRSLSQAHRNELVRDYLHATVRPRLAIPALTTLIEPEGHPLSREGGIMGPLVKELRGSRPLQQAILTASAEISQQHPIEESWPRLVQTLGVADALKTMTMISGFYTWQDAGGIPAEVMDAAHEAYNQTAWINQQRSTDMRAGNQAAAGATHLPRTQVMNHGSSDSFDNNTHFFAHAWLTYRMRQLGNSEQQALQTSAFAGAYYEMKRPGSLEENHGNGAIKDILMNAEGANYGVRLARDPHARLPAAHEGLPVEDKTI